MTSLTPGHGRCHYFVALPGADRGIGPAERDRRRRSRTSGSFDDRQVYVESWLSGCQPGAL